jgi:hypothetical protein
MQTSLTRSRWSRVEAPCTPKTAAAFSTASVVVGQHPRTRHPRLNEALPRARGSRQVVFAGFTHRPAVELPSAAGAARPPLCVFSTTGRRPSAPEDGGTGSWRRAPGRPSRSALVSGDNHAMSVGDLSPHRRSPTCSTWRGADPTARGAPGLCGRVSDCLPADPGRPAAPRRYGNRGPRRADAAGAGGTPCGREFLVGGATCAPAQHPAHRRRGRGFSGPDVCSPARTGSSPTSSASRRR